MPRPLLVVAAVAATLVMWASAFVGIRAIGDGPRRRPAGPRPAAPAAAVLGLVVAIRRPAMPARRDACPARALRRDLARRVLRAAERRRAPRRRRHGVDPRQAGTGAGRARRRGDAPRGASRPACWPAAAIALGRRGRGRRGRRGDATGVALGLGAAVAYAGRRDAAEAGHGPRHAARRVGDRHGRRRRRVPPFAPGLASQLPDVSTGTLAWLVYLGIFPPPSPSRRGRTRSPARRPAA